MADIVERLRRMDIATTGNNLADISEAAAEIERLRTALDDVRRSKMPGESKAIAIRALTTGERPK